MVDFLRDKFQMLPGPVTGLFDLPLPEIVEQTSTRPQLIGPLLRLISTIQDAQSRELAGILDGNPQPAGDALDQAIKLSQSILALAEVAARVDPSADSASRNDIERVTANVRALREGLITPAELMDSVEDITRVGPTLRRITAQDASVAAASNSVDLRERFISFITSHGGLVRFDEAIR